MQNIETELLHECYSKVSHYFSNSENVPLTVQAIVIKKVPVQKYPCISLCLNLEGFAELLD